MKKFCPFMTIGFAPPATKADKDERMCKTDCAWYNEDQEECAIVLISETIKDTNINVADIVDMMFDTTLPEYDSEV